MSSVSFFIFLWKLLWTEKSISWKGRHVNENEKKKKRNNMNLWTIKHTMARSLLICNSLLSDVHIRKYYLRVCKRSALCISSHQLAFSVGAPIKRTKIKHQNGLWALSQKLCMTIPSFPHQFIYINFASSSKHRRAISLWNSYSSDMFVLTAHVCRVLLCSTYPSTAGGHTMPSRVLLLPVHLPIWESYPCPFD